VYGIQLGAGQPTPTVSIPYLQKNHVEVSPATFSRLIIYVTDGIAENAVRPTKLGMKNWMFFGSAEAGWISACIYTLVENCKREGLNPEAYLKEVLSHLPSNPTPEEAAALTPGKIAAASRRVRKTA